MKYFYFLVIFLATQNSFCQTEIIENEQKITTILDNYFELEREAIHLHLNKTTFITKESIWYQGYIINRKTNKPYFTTNVFVVLYDEKGNKLYDELAYANNGSFSGKIDIKNEFDSGNYYIQVYTNWMNNFKENESTIQNIKIINPNQGFKNYSQINAESLQLFITPESGDLILGIANGIGIQIKDCRGNAPQDLDVTLQNSKGDVLNTIKLNTFGYGKFDFTPTNKSFKIVANYDNKIIEKQLPIAKETGISLRVNNYASSEKTIVNIKTNTETFKILKTKKLYLVIHQDANSTVTEFQINDSKLETTISIPHAELKSGINTIRIIDSDLNEYASRLVYIYPDMEKKITLLKSNKKDIDINIAGYTKYPNTSVSASILPEKTVAWNDNNNIFAAITINPYLTENLPHANYYFTNPDRKKTYELDMALLNQPTKKYDWNYMKVTKPAVNYSFDIGLTVKGKIDPSIKDKAHHKVKLMSKKLFMLFNSDVSETAEYQFEHILLPDSTKIEVSLFKIPSFEETNYKLKPYILNRNRPFYKPFPINIPEHCDDNLENLDLDFLEFSDKKAIVLKEVEIENKAKDKLTYANQFGNSYLTGFKIEGNLENHNLLAFIQVNGFIVVNNAGEFAIYSRLQTSINAAQPSPIIYIDGRQIFQHIELNNYNMSDIDEIYLNPNAIVPGISNYQGVIKIYTKFAKGFKYEPKKNPNEIYFTEGFSKYVNFKNAEYDNIGNNGFDTIGVLNWSPRILTDKEGSFILNFTDYNRQKGKCIIEGMTSEGILFQEEVTMDIK